MSERLLDGQSVLVTGANRGIGWATCTVLARNGANVWAGTRSLDDDWIGKLVTLAGDNDVAVDPIHLDVTDSALIKEAFAVIKGSGRPLSGLVNNAGVTFNGILQMTKVSDARAVMETNSFGTMQMMQGAVRLMQRQREGSIVNVSSTAAIDGNSGRSVYGASKAAVSTLTKTAAREWGPYGIRVNAVAPGMTDTDMLASMTDEVLAEVEGTTDLRRRGRPEEIAEAISFLVSPLSSYVSGQVLRVDGGMWV